MRKGLTEVVFILDRSGSMAGLERETIGGFNSLLEKQKKEAHLIGQIQAKSTLFQPLHRPHTLLTVVKSQGANLV